MSNLDMVIKAINYIETNLKEAITVTDVSDAAGYSPITLSGCSTVLPAILRKSIF